MNEERTKKSVMVSVCCLVFNHEPFLRECFEGFVMQKTTFPIEILVHDDASTDHSADIIREYTAKYPDLFKPIYQTENQYSQGKGFVGMTLNFERAKGKYIAMCEGDDYWTDPFKLQKQVDFMESDKKKIYTLCYHDSIKIDERGEIIESSIFSEKELSCEDLLRNCVPPMQTILFRNDIIQTERFYLFFDKAKNIVSGDSLLCFFLGQSGKGHGVFNVGKSVYRIHRDGIWSGKSTFEQNLNKYYLYSFLQKKDIRVYNYYLNRRKHVGSWLVLEASKKRKIIVKLYFEQIMISIREVDLKHIWKLSKGVIYNLLFKDGYIQINRNC